MQTFLHRGGSGVIGWRQSGVAPTPQTLAPADRHRRVVVSRGRRVIFTAARTTPVVTNGSASGPAASITLTVATASATGSAVAPGPAAVISLTPPTGSATGTSGGGASASASGPAAVISLTPPTGSATGSATASGPAAIITLTPAQGTASNGLYRASDLFVYVPIGNQPPGPLELFHKQPSEVLSYDIIFTEWLAALVDTAVTAVVTAESGITLDSFTLTGGVVTIWLSGGDPKGLAGTDYKVTIVLTTVLRVKEVEILVKVKDT